MSDLENDDMIDHIKRAFDQQPIPAVPDSAEFMNTATETTLQRQHSLPAFFNSDRLGQLVATISVVVVCVILARAFWQTDDDKTTQNAPQIVVDPEPVAAPPEPKPPEPKPQKPVIAEATPNQTNPIETDKPAPTVPHFNEFDPPATKQVPTVATPSTFLQAVTEMNRCLRTGTNDPDSLATAFDSYFEQDNRILASAFKAMGVPKGIKSVTDGVSKPRSWLHDDSEVAFTYGADFPLIMSDYRTFIDHYFGDRLFDALLEGIRDDVDGPRIDVRRDIVPEFLDQFVLVINRQQRGVVDAVMIAIPVRDPQPILRCLHQAADVDPEVNVRTYGSTPIIVTSAPGKPRSGLCLAANHFIIGELAMVHRALDRIPH